MNSVVAVITSHGGTHSDAHNGSSGGSTSRTQPGGCEAADASKPFYQFGQKSIIGHGGRQKIWAFCCGLVKGWIGGDKTSIDSLGVPESKVKMGAWDCNHERR